MQLPYVKLNGSYTNVCTPCKVNSVDWWIESTLYVIYLVKMLCMVRLRNNKCSETDPKRRCSGAEQYQYLFRCCH